MVKKVIQKIVVGGAMVTAVAVPSNIAHKEKQLNKELRAEFKAQIQIHEAQAESLMKSIHDLQGEIESNKKMIQELEAENQSLEGVRLNIINSVGYFPNDYERGLLERLVECEAGAESMEGKIAVANVVLNRVKSERYPNSIHEVIYATNQFQPVGTGIIDSKVASAESKEAVKRAFMGERVVPDNVVSFWASWLDKSHPMWDSVDILTTIGVHHFGGDWN